MKNVVRHSERAALVLALVVFIGGCQRQSESDKTKESRPMKNQLSIEKTPFGKAPDGKSVDLFTLTNVNGLKASIMTYGGILVSLEVPDRNGKLDDIVLGYDSLGGYVDKSPYFGAIVGRYANRIANGRFALRGVTYRLATNDGKNHLHGGYPGNLSCTVVYLLTNRNELIITYDATTDKPTVIDLTHHSYFNLAGQGTGDILHHELFINASTYTPVDKGLIPTGELRNVKRTPMDFTTPTAIGARIAQVEGGYDHNYVLEEDVQ